MGVLCSVAWRADDEGARPDYLAVLGPDRVHGAFGKVNLRGAAWGGGCGGCCCCCCGSAGKGSMEGGGYGEEGEGEAAA